MICGTLLCSYCDCYFKPSGNLASSMKVKMIAFVFLAYQYIGLKACIWKSSRLPSFSSLQNVAEIYHSIVHSM